MAISFIGSTDGSATNGNSVTITLPGPPEINDCVVGAYVIGSSRAAPTLTATTSSTSVAYTQIVATLRSSSCHFAVFRKIITSTSEDRQIRFFGTGNSSDSMAGAAMIFRGVDTTTPEDVTATSTTGSGTTPDSPSITVASSDDVVISAVGAQVNDTSVTLPTSFNDQTDAAANDNWDSTIGMAWIQLASTSAFNPTSWTNFTSATWASASVALKTQAQFTDWYPYTTHDWEGMMVHAREVVIKSYHTS